LKTFTLMQGTWIVRVSHYDSVFGEQYVTRKVEERDTKEFQAGLRVLRTVNLIVDGVSFSVMEPDDTKKDCQDEPHLIASDSDEADAILDMWEGGK
jgi:hypothetical protein